MILAFFLILLELTCPTLDLSIEFILLHLFFESSLVSYPCTPRVDLSGSILDYIPTPGFGWSSLLHFLPEVVFSLAITVLLLIASVEIARGNDRKLLALAN